MLGCDVVFIRPELADKNLRTKRLIKLYHPSEVDCIQNSENPFQMECLLWSLKESAVKAHTASQRLFSPKKVMIESIDPFERTAKISYRDNNFYAHYTLHTDRVVSWCSDVQDFNGSIFDRKVVYQNESIQYVHDVLNMKHPELEISVIKNGQGKPELFIDQLKIEGGLSISHDGPYLLFVTSFVR